MDECMRKFMNSIEDRIIELQAEIKSKQQNIALIVNVLNMLYGNENRTASELRNISNYINDRKRYEKEIGKIWIEIDKQYRKMSVFIGVITQKKNFRKQNARDSHCSTE